MGFPEVVLTLQETDAQELKIKDVVSDLTTSVTKTTTIQNTDISRLSMVVNQVAFVLSITLPIGVVPNEVFVLVTITGAFLTAGPTTTVSYAGVTSSTFALDVSVAIILAFLYISLYLQDRIGLFCEVRWEDILSASPHKSLPMFVADLYLKLL